MAVGMNSIGSPSTESLFLVVSFGILISAVIYWLWSHIQLTHKKTVLLEAAVFELRALMMMGPAPQGSQAQPQAQQAQPQVQQAQSTQQQGGEPVYQDLDDMEDTDDWPTPDLAVEGDADEGVLGDMEEVPDELMPGGVPMFGDVSDSQIAHIPTATVTPITVTKTDTTSVAPEQSAGSALDGMSVRDLRRLADQRGIPGAHNLKRKELMIALRGSTQAPAQAPTQAPAPVQTEAADTKVLDLTLSDESVTLE